MYIKSHDLLTGLR